MILFQLTQPDLIFFIVILAIIGICVLAYFLVPVFKRKQFAEARANLARREETFRANLKSLQPVETNTTTIEEEKPKAHKKEDKIKSEKDTK